MSYSLHRLAAGSYDLLLKGAIVGSVVREVGKNGFVRGWRAELMSDKLPMPVPFTQETHAFKTFEAAVAWLGGRVLIEGRIGRPSKPPASSLHWMRQQDRGTHPATLPLSLIGFQRYRHLLVRADHLDKVEDPALRQRVRL